MVRLHAVLYPVIPAAVGLAAAGCAQLAGIQDTNGNGRPGDALAVTRMSVGSNIVRAPLDPTGLTATYFVASGDPSGFDRVPATLDPAHGGWTTKLRAAAPVEFTLPDVPTPIPRLFAFSSSQLSVLYGVLEHPSPQAAPMNATFAVNVALDAAVVAGQSFQTYVVGAWLQRGFSAAEAPATATQIAPPAFAFTSANVISGRGRIDRITADDAFLILRYTGAVLTGVAEAMPVDQSGVDGMVTTPMFPKTMVAVTPGPMSPMFSATIAPSALAARYMTVQPPAPTPLQVQMNWSLVAAPGYTIASNAGPVLNSGGLVMTDTGVNVSYENPFADRHWNTIFTLATAVNRVYMAPLGPMGAALPVTLQAGMNQFLEPPSPSAPVSLDLPAGLPQVITLDGVALKPDGLTIKPRTRFVEVSITVDTPASAAGQAPTLYNLQLFDLVFNSTTMVIDRVVVFAAASKDPAFALPPELFQTGHSYNLRAISTLGGYPTIDQGDFTHRQLPLAQSYLDSGVFTVMP